MGHDGLNNMLAAYEDKSAYAMCIFSYMSEDLKEPKLFVGKTPVMSIILLLRIFRVKLYQLEEVRTLAGIQFSSLMDMTRPMQKCQRI